MRFLLKNKLTVLALMGIFLAGKSWAAINYSTGAYKAKTFDNSIGNIQDMTDKSGTAFNQVDFFWKRSIAEADGVGLSSAVTISNTGWTFVPATGSITQDRLGVWVSPSILQAGKFLVNFTTDPLALPTTSAGLLMRPSDDPWQLAISSKCYLIMIDNNGTPEPAFYKELR